MSQVAGEKGYTDDFTKSSAMYFVDGQEVSNPRYVSKRIDHVEDDFKQYLILDENDSILEDYLQYVPNPYRAAAMKKKAHESTFGTVNVDLEMLKTEYDGQKKPDFLYGKSEYGWIGKSTLPLSTYHRYIRIIFISPLDNTFRNIYFITTNCTKQRNRPSACDLGTADNTLAEAAYNTVEIKRRILSPVVFTLIRKELDTENGRKYVDEVRQANKNHQNMLNRTLGEGGNSIASGYMGGRRTRRRQKRQKKRKTRTRTRR